MEKKTVVQCFNQYDFQSLISKKFTQSSHVFHYTSIDKLLKILSRRKLRFSNRLYLNDYSEGKYVLELCMKKVDDIWPSACKYQKEAFLDEIHAISEHISYRQFHIYQASFSLNGDSLTMWNYYAKGDGANIQFSLSKVIEYFQKQFLSASQWPVGFLHGPVIYNQAQQIEILNKLLADFANSESNMDEWYMFAAWAVLYIGTFFKHEGFSDEREYRIAYNLFFDPYKPEQSLTLRSIETNKPYCVEVEQRGNMLVPYIDIDFDVTAMEQITLSPRLETENIANGLKMFLRQNKHDTANIRIVRSEIPVRF